MRQRFLILLFANGIIVYVLIVARIHYVSTQVQEQTRLRFPGVNETNAITMHEAVLAGANAKVNHPMGRTDLKEYEGQIDGTPSHKVHVPSRRNEAI